jgi:hypothetical protein
MSLTRPHQLSWASRILSKLPFRTTSRCPVALPLIEHGLDFRPPCDLRNVAPAQPPRLRSQSGEGSGIEAAPALTAQRSPPDLSALRLRTYTCYAVSASCWCKLLSVQVCWQMEICGIVTPLADFVNQRQRRPSPGPGRLKRERQQRGLQKHGLQRTTAPQH